MKTLQKIRYTFNTIIEMYLEGGKRLFSFSVNFSMISLLFSLVLGFIITYLFSKFYKIFSPFEPDLYDNPFTEIFFDLQNTSTVTALFVFNLGLLGIYFNTLKNNFFHEKISIKHMRETLSSSNWNTYWTLLSFLVIIYFILFKDIFTVNNDELGLFNIYNDPSQSSRNIRFYRWFNSIIDLFKVILPYFLAMMMFAKEKSKMKYLNILKTYKYAIFAGLVLSFFTEIFSENIYFYLKHYVVELINIPFQNIYYSSAISIVIYIVIFSYFLPSVVGALSFPFTHESKSSFRNEDLLELEEE